MFVIKKSNSYNSILIIVVAGTNINNRGFERTKLFVGYSYGSYVMMNGEI
jgi:hypothetical protein